MNLAQLLAQREMLLKQTRLANLAYAYSQLHDFAARIARAQLRGRVSLRHAAPEEDLYCATLTALEGNQSVLDEHFTDLDAMDLADVIAFVRGQNSVHLTFRIEEFADKFLAPLRLEIERLGVFIDEIPAAGSKILPQAASSSDHQQIEEKS
jgi:hypothetical protein